MRRRPPPLGGKPPPAPTRRKRRSAQAASGLPARHPPMGCARSAQGPQASPLSGQARRACGPIQSVERAEPAWLVARQSRTATERPGTSQSNPVPAKAGTHQFAGAAAPLSGSGFACAANSTPWGRASPSPRQRRHPPPNTCCLEEGGAAWRLETGHAACIEPAGAPIVAAARVGPAFAGRGLRGRRRRVVVRRMLSAGLRSGHRLEPLASPAGGVPG